MCAICTAVNEEKDEILLATVLVRIRMKHGWSEPVRALIDQGSTGAFCTEKLVQELGLTRREVKTNVKYGVSVKRSLKYRKAVWRFNSRPDIRHHFLQERQLSSWAE